MLCGDDRANLVRTASVRRSESRAGDLNIDVGRTSDYGKLEASVKAGDINARPFNVSKGGLFRSFSWQGRGRYTLHASLLAGDLTLFSSK